MTVAFQILGDDAGGFGSAVARRIDRKLRRFRPLVSGINAREVLDLASASLAIKTFRIALFADCKWRIDEDLQKLASVQKLPRQQSLGTIWRNEGDEDDQSG